MSADDHTLAVQTGPKGVSLFLEDIAAFFRGELHAGGGDLVLPRFLAKLLEIAFAESAARVDAFEEADRALRRELAVRRAEIAQMEQKLLLLAPPSDSSGCRMARPRPAMQEHACRVFDFSAALGREMGRAAADRPGGPEGGAS